MGLFLHQLFYSIDVHICFLVFWGEAEGTCLFVVPMNAGFILNNYLIYICECHGNQKRSSDPTKLWVQASVGAGSRLWSSSRAVSAPMHCADSPATMFITKTLRYNLKSDIVKSTAVFSLLKIVFIFWGL